MEIAIFRNTNINALQDDINDFLDKHDHNIDVKKIVQSSIGDEIIITILIKVMEVF